MAEGARKKRGRPTNAEIIAQAQAEEIEGVKPEMALAAVEGVIKEPFALAAKATGYAGFELPDELAKASAPHAKVLLDYYAPTMSPLSAAWFSLAVALGPHTWKGFTGWRAWKKEQELGPGIPPDPDRPAAAAAASSAQQGPSVPPELARFDYPSMPK